MVDGAVEDWNKDEDDLLDAKEDSAHLATEGEVDEHLFAQTKLLSDRLIHRRHGSRSVRRWQG